VLRLNEMLDPSFVYTRNRKIHLEKRKRLLVISTGDRKGNVLGSIMVLRTVDDDNHPPTILCLVSGHITK